MTCLIFWGSHGCDKPAGHVEAGDVVHACGVPGNECSEMIVLGPEHDDYSADAVANAAVRYMTWSAATADADPASDDGWTCQGWGYWWPSRWYS